MTTREHGTTTRTVLPEDAAAPNAAWDAIAERYDEFATPKNMLLGERAVEHAGVGPGHRFLDVACGSGALAIPAARAGAEVLAVDLAASMLDRLQARARTEGLSNLIVQRMNGMALSLDDDTFDVAGSQFGVSLFPDLGAGLRELVRVTKPGGRVLLVAFGAPSRAEFIGVFMAAMQAVVPDFVGLPMDPPPLPFQVAEPEKLRHALTQAGLSDVRIETTDHPMEFESGTHMWDMVTSSNPIGAGLVAGLSAEQRTDVQRVLDDMLRERSGRRGGTVHTQVHIAVGTA
jgi:ubiquinone/menaquinone biosynthesis C-methylase UbiE